MGTVDQGRVLGSKEVVSYVGWGGALQDRYSRAVKCWVGFSMVSRKGIAWVG